MDGAVGVLMVGQLVGQFSNPMGSTVLILVLVLVLVPVMQLSDPMGSPVLVLLLMLVLVLVRVPVDQS